jgi:putative salt-induced outer membrane protein YdiY
MARRSLVFIFTSFTLMSGASAQAVPPKTKIIVTPPVSMAQEAQEAIGAAHEAARDAAKAAHAAAEAAKSAADAAKSTADAVQTLATHVEDIEHPEPSEGPPLPEWSYQLSLGGLANTGNSSTFAYKLSAGIDGNWHNWGTEFRLSHAYGATDPIGIPPDEVTTSNGHISARGSHNYTAYVGNYVLGGVTYDHVASIRYQAYGELGLTIDWWEVETHGYVKSRLRTSVGARAMRESRRQYYPTPQELPSRLIYGPPITVNYRYAINKGLYITEDADFLYNIAEPNDMRGNSATALVVKLNEMIALQVGFKIRYIGQPAPDKKKVDTETSTNLTFSL